MLRNLFGLALAAGLSAGVAFAQCTGEKTTAQTASSGSKCCAKKGEETASGSKCCAKKSGEAVASACSTASKCSMGTVETACGMKVAMPVMAYKVGDKTVQCCAEAAKLADNDQSKIQFVVGEKSFACKNEAMTAYAEALDTYLGSMMTVQYGVGEKTMSCPASAESMAKEQNASVRYVLASYNFPNKEAAEKAAEAAKEAAGKISMKMVVDGKEYCCKSMASSAAAKSESKKIEYVVGDAKSCDETEAKVALSRAKIMAAAQALKSASDSTGKVADARNG